jgi:hypothetical protein
MKNPLALVVALSLAAVPGIASANSSCSPGRNGDGQHYWVGWMEQTDDFQNTSKFVTSVKETQNSMSPVASLNSSTSTWGMLVVNRVSNDQRYAQIGYRVKNAFGVTLREDFIQVQDSANGGFFYDHTITNATPIDQTAIFEVLWVNHITGGTSGHGFKFFRNGSLVDTYPEGSDFQWTPDTGTMDSEVGSSADQMYGGWNNHWEKFTLMRYGFGLSNNNPTYLYGGSSYTQEITRNDNNSWFAGRFHLDGADTMATWDRYCA